MSKELSNARSAIDTFIKKAVAWEASLKKGEVTFSAKGDPVLKGNLGEALDLVYALNETRQSLSTSSTPTRTDFDAGLNLDVLKRLNKKRLKKINGLTEAARKVIKLFRSPSFINAWKAALPVVQLEIVAKMVEAAPLLDQFDPRDPIPGNTESAETDRFLSDAAMGRASIFEPDLMEQMVKSLPIIHAPDGTPAFTIGVPPSVIERITGENDVEVLLKWAIKALSNAAGFMTVVTNVPSQQIKTANAMLSAYTKLLDGIDQLDVVKALPGPAEKLAKIEELVTENGLKNVPATKATRILKGLQYAGVPLGLIDGFLKVSVGVNKVNAAGNPLTALKETAALFGEATKLLATAVENFGRKGAKALAKKVLSVVAIPMLCLELNATYNGIEKAVREGDLSVAFGHAVLGIVAVGAAAFTFYTTFCVGAAAGGPPGLLVAVVTGVILSLTLLGLYLVELTSDSDLEKFANCCVFGKGMKDWTQSTPGDVTYKFGKPGDLSLAAMSEKLFSLRTAVGLGTSSGSTNISFDLTHARMKTEPDGTKKSTLPSAVRTRCFYIGDPARETVHVPLPGFDDGIFRKKGGVSLVYGSGQGDVQHAWRGKWVKLEVSHSPDKRVPKTIEYVKIP